MLGMVGVGRAMNVGALARRRRGGVDGVGGVDDDEAAERGDARLGLRVDEVRRGGLEGVNCGMVIEEKSRRSVGRVSCISGDLLGRGRFVLRKR